VVVVRSLGEQASTFLQRWSDQWLVQEPEQAEGHLQVVGYRSPAEQGSPLEGHADAAHHHVGYVLAGSEAEAGSERPGKPQGEPLVRALATQAGPPGLATLVHDLTGPTGTPGAEAPTGTRVGPLGGAHDGSGNVRRGSH